MSQGTPTQVGPFRSIRQAILWTIHHEHVDTYEFTARDILYELGLNWGIDSVTYKHVNTVLDALCAEHSILPFDNDDGGSTIYRMNDWNYFITQDGLLTNSDKKIPSESVTDEVEVEQGSDPEPQPTTEEYIDINVLALRSNLVDKLIDALVLRDIDQKTVNKVIGAARQFEDYIVNG